MGGMYAGNGQKESRGTHLSSTPTCTGCRFEEAGGVLLPTGACCFCCFCLAFGLGAKADTCAGGKRVCRSSCAWQKAERSRKHSKQSKKGMANTTNQVTHPRHANTCVVTSMLD
jgi:hypothetical protein